VHTVQGIHCPSLTRPWTAATNVIGKVVKGFMDPEYVLRVRPKSLLDSNFWSWGSHFMLRNDDQKVSDNSNLLARLGLYSRSCYDDIKRENAITDNDGSIGSLQVFGTSEELSTAVSNSDAIKRAGVTFRTLQRDELFDVEPLLRQSERRNSLVGGLFSSDDSAGDCRIFTTSLFQLISSHPNCRCLFGHNVTGIESRGASITRIVTDKGDIQCDSLVLATASHTGPLAKLLKLSIPVYPVKVIVLVR
jgi:D-amino-acid dehydrogenase